MLRKSLSVLLFISLAFSFGITYAGLFDGGDQVVETMGTGEVNWSANVIRSVGSGAPNPEAPNVAVARLGAERAAKLDAMRNLLETVKGVRIDSQTSVVNFTTQSDVINSRVEGTVKGARVVKTKYLSDGGVEVIIEVPITGGLADTVYGNLTDLGSAAVPKAGSPVYTGLIIDAKGTGARPAMSPKILDEDGKEVYGSAYVSREFAIKQGIVGYAKDVNAAKQNERVTANPIVVKGLKTTGSGGSDIVISNADAAGLRDVSKNLSFLEQTRVLVVVD
ncbi:MAG: LPP20 family lipoprotein [Deltaproteobacteria bacterium]|nr:LPP20 family lipoprotein [Deltaproteobacteria bacterium]